jgi:hypothetical protein
MRLRATEAVGRIELPKAALEFNPMARTLVNLDTWFWAAGLSGQELRGTPALGLVAIAAPSKLTVDPGDGSAPFTCEWVTAKSNRCRYTYRHSSAGGSLRGSSGAPAYQATGTATWTLRFERNGASLPISGAPPVLTRPVGTTAVEVAEVQTLVTSAG